MNNKSVVIIGPAYPLRGGGMATFNERLAYQFIADGYHTTIYTFSLQYPSALFPGTTQFSNEPAPKGLNIKVCINSISPYNWLRIGFQLKKLQPDFIVVRFWMPFFGPCLGTILRLVKKNKHTKIICIADNIIPHEKRIGDIFFTKYFIRSIDKFIVMSQQVLTDLKKFTTITPVKLIPHPLYDNFGEKIVVEMARQTLGIDKNIKIILFFGFIRKYKGLDILLEAVAILKSKNTFPNFKLLIGGEFYDDKTLYEQQIKQLGIKDKLILKTDFIPNTEVKNYFCAADLVVQPYRNATQSGVTPLAYHFEVPMVVTNVGGLPDMVPNGIVGYVAEPNAEDIAAKIEQFFTHDATFFKDNIKTEKKKFSWQKMVEAIV